MISTKGRYALRVLLDMAEHDDGSYIPLKDIAERQGISKKYLEFIVKDLVQGGLISGTSGKGGGYRLLRAPKDYTVGEVLELTEGKLSAVACLASKDFDCPRKDECETLPMWKEYDDMIHDFFYGKRLSDIMSEGTEKE